MDPKELRGLMEAYSEVYAPQEVDEAITSEKGKAKAAEMIAKRTTASGRAKPGQGDNVATIKHISRSNRDGLLGTPPNRKVAGSNWPKSYTGIGGTGNKAARRAAALKKEEVDIFDVVLEFLQAEGFAETLEEAEWLMANLIDEEAVAIILEDYYEGDEEDLDEGASGNVAARAQKLANQRKGQTPERKKMYQGLADKAAERERGPFKRGTSRQDMTPAERTRSREAAAYQADVHGGSATYGKGSLPKGKKLERQRARGVSERFEAWLDETIRNPESRKKLRAIMDREVVKGDKSKGQNPRKKYHTKTGNQAFSLLVKRDETDAPKAPVRKRGGTSAPSEERPSKSDRAQSAKYWAGAAGPSRDRGAGNRAARRAGKTVNDNRED